MCSFTRPVMAVTRTVNQSAPDLQFVEKVFDLSKEYHLMLAWGTVKLGMFGSADIQRTQLKGLGAGTDSQDLPGKTAISSGYFIHVFMKERKNFLF